MQMPTMKIIPAHTVKALEQLKQLFREYPVAIGMSLDFQDFEAELAALPGKYTPPAGELFLALRDDKALGCIAFYPMDKQGVCEIKRLYVRPEAQGSGLGRSLLAHAIKEARQRGYKKARLDSLRRMTQAGRLYELFGFQQIPPYNHNPHPDVYYMELDLTGSSHTETPL